MLALHAHDVSERDRKRRELRDAAVRRPGRVCKESVTAAVLALHAPRCGCRGTANVENRVMRPLDGLGGYAKEKRRPLQCCVAPPRCDAGEPQPSRQTSRRQLMGIGQLEPGLLVSRIPWSPARHCKRLGAHFAPRPAANIKLALRRGITHITPARIRPSPRREHQACKRREITHITPGRWAGRT